MLTPAASRPLSGVQIDRLAASNLKRLRMRAHVSAARLGLALEVRPDRITDIEQGRGRLRVDILVRAAEVLAVPVERFFEDMPGSVEAIG